MNNIKSGFWNNGWVIFFLAPFIFFLATRLMGYHIFYGQATMQKKNPKQVFLLAGGALFYLVLLIVLVAYS